MYKIVLTIFYYVGNHPEHLKIRAFVVSRRLRWFGSWAWPGGWVEFRVAGPRAPEGCPRVLERVRGGPSARGGAPSLVAQTPGLMRELAPVPITCLRWGVGSARPGGRRAVTLTGLALVWWRRFI